MFKSFLMFMLGAICMYACLVLWAAYDMMRLGMRRGHQTQQFNQDGGEGDDTFNNITINIPDGKGHGK